MFFNIIFLWVYSVLCCVVVIFGYLVGMESLRFYFELINYLFVVEVEECSFVFSGCGSVGRVFKRVDCIFLEGCV